jgi:cation:H+ antiporter
MLTALLPLLGGLALLMVGGELLVRGSVRLAERMGVSPLLIGLTLVGFGTSTPELVASVQAALIGSPGIAVGNIVGSNIANIFLILGVSALICPLAVKSEVLKRDGGVVLLSALLLGAAGWTVGLSRPVGAILVLLLVAYLVYAYRTERVAVDGHTAAFDKAEAAGGVDPALRPRSVAGTGWRAWAVPLLTAVGGLAVIVLGGRLLVDGAVTLARIVGLSEEVIGLTVVAAGTSAPELVTSIVAAVRRQSEVALGNVLGSNIYNAFGIGGLTALIAPTPVPAQIAWFDLPVMIGASLVLLAFAWTGRRLSRLEGGVLLAAYVGYVGYLLLAVDGSGV